MLNRVKMAVAAALLAAVPSAARASTFAFTGSFDRSGDTSGPVQIADDFTVNAVNGINVTQLGLFIDGYDGFTVPGASETHKVALINRSNGQVIASANISSTFNTIDGPYSYVHPNNSQSFNGFSQGAFGYVNITPQLLPNGFQGSIVAYTLSDGGAYIDDYGEAANFNSGGGLISFVHSYLASTGNTSGDPLNNSSNTPRAGGSFTFSAAAPTPEPGSLGVLAVGLGAALRRKRR